MSQHNSINLDPTLRSGVDLPGIFDALQSLHSGPGRPGYAQPYMMWAKEVSASRVDLMWYDGVGDRLIVALNPQTGDLVDAAPFLRDAEKLGGHAPGRFLPFEFGSSVNLILNGDFSIDRDGGSTKAPGIGVYTFDIWRGHVDGLEQIVEALPAGDYTLIFDGGGTGHVAGQMPAASPAVFTVAADGDQSVVVPSTATRVMLLPGDHTGVVDLAFRARPPQFELLLLGRYYLPNLPVMGSGSASSSGKTARCNMHVNFPVEMRVPPSVSYDLGQSDKVKNNPFSGTSVINVRGMRFSPESTAAGDLFWAGNVSCDARFVT